MKFIDLFSGIGGFRSALENNGHECLAFAEIDKYARQSYKAIYNTENEEEWHDVTRITDDDFRYYQNKADIITGGFPCQAFSIAGKRAGFEDTRGTLFFEIARAIKEVQPSYVLLENVKGLFSHDGGRTFGTIIQALDELGYVTEWGLFNSKYWGVPQNRERVYILATRKDKFKEPLLFDLVKQQTEVTTRLIDVLEDEVDEKYYLSEEKTRKLTLDHDLGGKLNMYDYNERDKIHSVNKVSPTLNTMQGGDRQPKIAVPVLTPDRINKRQNGRRFKDDGEPMFTLTAQDRHGIIIDDTQGYDGVRTYKGISPTLRSSRSGLKTIDNLRIRKLTALECWRLQGFTDDQFYKAKESGVSNSQLYKQSGNSVTVNVVDAIVKQLKE